MSIRCNIYLTDFNGMSTCFGLFLYLSLEITFIVHLYFLFNCFFPVFLAQSYDIKYFYLIIGKWLYSFKYSYIIIITIWFQITISIQ